MFQILKNTDIVYDPRDTSRIIGDPVFITEVNTVGSASFSLFPNHPEYNNLNKVKDIFELLQDYAVIWRGRMIYDSTDFYNVKTIKLEGILAALNDSQIEPFNFPEDFTNNNDYQTAAAGGNVVQFFFSWILNQHNAQVQSWQKIKIGNVTITDPNNYLSRSATEYNSAWKLLNDKLFGSSLGGYIIPRFEADGTYLDYVADFELTNTQHINFQNLCDLQQEKDATEIYTAMIPLGAKVEQDDGTEKQININLLNDGTVSGSIIKSGKYLYDSAAVAMYGWLCAPVDLTTWEDVTEAENLKIKGVTWLTNVGVMLTNTVTATAIDLHLTDAQVAAIRPNRYVIIDSVPHGLNGGKRLTKLELKLFDLSNSLITINDTFLSLTDSNNKKYNDNIKRIIKTEVDIAENRKRIVSVAQEQLTQSTSIINNCQSIILSALEEYIKTSDYESYKETVKSEFAVMADQVNMNFTQVTEQIQNVNGDLQSKFNELSRYFNFSINGFEIGNPNAPYKMILTEEKISIYNQDNEVLWVKELDTHIPYLAVTEAFNLFGYLFTEEDGIVNCEYAGTGVYE